MVLIRKALIREYNIIPVLSDEIESQEHGQELRYTEVQKYVMDLLEEQKLAAIRGGAGTGKTLLALAKAQNLAWEGKRTLLLCYTSRLADWLQNLASPDCKENLMVCTYHSFAKNFCLLAGIDFNPEKYNYSSEFWDVRAPNLLTDAGEILEDEDKFDAVVVDEGRDFVELWWASFDWIIRDRADRIFYIFFDPKQNIFSRDDWKLLDEMEGHRYPLFENFRNTAKIANHCAELVDIPTRSEIAPMLVQKDIETYLMPNIAEARKLAGEIVRELSNKERLSFSQVVILVAENFKLPNFDSIPVTDKIDAWQKNKGIFVSTIHAFKGLEADAVIIIARSVSNDESERNLQLNYVGRSRAKHILRVIELDYH